MKIFHIKNRKSLPLFTLLALFIFQIFFCGPVSAIEQKGMALGLFSKDPHYSYKKDLEEMQAIGVTHVMLVVSWYQKDIHSAEIKPLPYDGHDIMTVPDEKVMEVIEQAHLLGLKTLLFPILRLEVRNDKDWRGIIDPTDKAAWWKSYTQFISHYAKIAAQKNVDDFSVGSELLSREKDTPQWKELISKTRSLYRGKLLYSANWDHYEHPAFWKYLDYIGMTAYHELTQNKSPQLKELKESWEKIKSTILSWKKKYPKQKLVITEIGYPSLEGSSSAPWNYVLDGETNLTEQALCYRAFIETWKDSRELGGVYFWVWWGDGGINDKSYTPRAKPAALLLKYWFNGSRI